MIYLRTLHDVEYIFDTNKIKCKRNYEEFEDTKGIIRIRKLKKDGQHNGKTLHIKLKIA